MLVVSCQIAAGVLRNPETEYLQHIAVLMTSALLL